METKPERDSPDARSGRSATLPAIESVSALRELVGRIVSSPTFARSERLSELLTYICELALQGREAELNEQKIGQKVFGRPQDYDSSVDGIVRSQASRLRQRLELYFQQDGAEEPVRIFIPRGGYVPVFETQAPSVPLSATDLVADASPGILPSPSSPTADRPTQTHFSWQWFPWAISVVLSVMLAALWIHDQRAPAADTAQTHPFWSLLFTKNRPTLVVAPDSGLVLYHGASGQDVDLKEYLDGDYRTGPAGVGPYQMHPTSSRKDWLLDLANRRYTSVVDLKMIVGLKDRARTLASDIALRYARDLRPDDLKSGNAILLGSREADPWDELFHHNLNFILEDDYKGTFAVINRNPQKGEPERWVSVLSDPQRRVYGLAAYLPNLSGDGNTLLLEGTGMSGTQAAMDFVTDDAELLPFLKKIRRADGTLPHFEILLGTQNMGASAVRVQILAWRTMN